MDKNRNINQSKRRVLHPERTFVIKVKNVLANNIKPEDIKQVIEELIRVENGTVEIKVQNFKATLFKTYRKSYPIKTE